jgi:hypothetical protein
MWSTRYVAEITKRSARRPHSMYGLREAFGAKGIVGAFYSAPRPRLSS